MANEYDDLTLEEYLASLSESDIKLMDGVPLKIEELIDIDDEELDALKIRNGLTEEDQTRRSEIFEKIMGFRIFAKVEREARQHHWHYNDSNGNGDTNGGKDNTLSLCYSSW